MIDEELNDPLYLENTRTTRSSELEPLYWAVEDAIHTGDLVRARSIYKAFVYIARYRKHLLREGLQAAYITRLQQIAYELYSDNSYKKQQPITIKHAILSKAIPFQREEDLRNYIATHPDILNILDPHIQIRGMEIPTENGYRCDILAESTSHYYPIELKIGQTNHAVVSQICKYCYYFYRQFRYGWHKPIQGVVIANGFDDWSINELRREGIILLEVLPNNKDDIVLKKVS